MARHDDTPSSATPDVGVVGAGRLGKAMAAALAEAGARVDGPARRGEVPSAEVIVLCVPDADIPTAAAAVAGAASFVGHTSGATPLAALEPAGAEAFGLHPLQAFTGSQSDVQAGVAELGSASAEHSPALELFAGAGCAVAGTTPEALAVAQGLAERLRMTPFVIEDERRAAYHAAASIASNFLVALEATAEEVAGAAGLSAGNARALLLPLVRRTIDNYAALGPERALTGPVARGDEQTVAAQREALAESGQHLLPLFDELAARARALAALGKAYELGTRAAEAA